MGTRLNLRRSVDAEVGITQPARSNHCLAVEDPEPEGVLRDCQRAIEILMTISNSVAKLNDSGVSREHSSLVALFDNLSGSKAVQPKDLRLLLGVGPGDCIVFEPQPDGSARRRTGARDVICCTAWNPAAASAGTRHRRNE